VLHRFHLDIEKVVLMFECYSGTHLPQLSMKYGRQSIERYARDGDLSVDRCARHELDGNRTQDTRFIQVQAVSVT
jgi:hypothetical protein